MKSIGVTLQRTYLTGTAKRNIVRHPAKLSNILGLTLKCTVMQIERAQINDCLRISKVS